MRTPRAAVALALAGLLVTSGCIGFLTGEEALTVSSKPVDVNESATQETGYEQVRKGSSTMNRTFAAGGQTRNVTVTNHVAEYARSVGLPVFGDQQVARFTVFSTPKVGVLGQTFNPVGKMNNTELALMLQEQYATIDNVQRVSETSRTVLGKETTVTKFRADAKMINGQSTEVYFHLTKVEHGEDFVIALGIYPRQLEGEQQKVFRMMEGIDHPANGTDAG